MFLVTGATGQLGHAIVRHLADRVGSDQVIATCRNPDKASDLTQLGIEVRRGDFSDLKSLHAAFAGASQVLLVSSNARAHGGDPLAQHRHAIAAARHVGAQRIVYTSHMAASALSAFPPMHDHAATELMLRDSGMAWTALRHGFYAASGIAMLATALDTGTLDMATDGPVAWTAHADLAEAAARILTDTARPSGPTPPLTASQALSLSELATLASDISGKAIKPCIHSDDDMRAKMALRGLSAPVMKIAMGFYAAARRGEFSTTDPTLETWLGRPPTRMHDLMAMHIGATARAHA